MPKFVLVSGYFLSNSAAIAPEIGLRLLDRYAGPEPRDPFEVMHAALLRCRFGAIGSRGQVGEGDVDVDRLGRDRIRHARRQDADDRVGTSIQLDALTENALVAAELFLPELMRKHDLEPARTATGLFVLAREAVADHRLEAEDVKEVTARAPCAGWSPPRLVRATPRSWKTAMPARVRFWSRQSK